MLHAEPFERPVRLASHGIEHAGVDEVNICCRALPSQQTIHDGGVRSGKSVVCLIKHNRRIRRPEVGVAYTLGVGKVVELPWICRCVCNGLL